MDKCPVCGSPNIAVFGQVQSDEAAQHFVLRESEGERHEALRLCIERLWEGDRATWRACGTCGFRFIDPFVAGDEEFYQLAFGGSGYPADKWEFSQTLEVLKNQPPGGNALEIGAGAGHFLKLVSPGHYPATQVTALEYNASTRGILQDAGYRVLDRDFRDLARDGEKFDAVFMFQVLEHLDQPQETFAALFQLLREGGELFLAVPNPRSIEFNEQNNSLSDMPPNHIARWSAESIRRMADGHGFTVVDLRAEPFSLSRFIRQDLVYSYGKRAQCCGTLANRLFESRKTPLGRVVNAAAVLAHAPFRLGVWARARHMSSGGSLWAHLKKAPL
jgi:SAM-dependent methyltransferase